MSLRSWLASAKNAPVPTGPDVIGSGPEMDELPQGARVLDRFGHVWVRYPEGWSIHPEGKHRAITGTMLYRTLPRAFPGVLLPPEN